MATRTWNFCIDEQEAHEILWLLSEPAVVNLVKGVDRERGGHLARLACRIAAHDADGAGQWAVVDAPLWALKIVLSDAMAHGDGEPPKGVRDPKALSAIGRQIKATAARRKKTAAERKAQSDRMRKRTHRPASSTPRPPQAPPSPSARSAAGPAPSSRGDL